MRALHPFLIKWLENFNKAEEARKARGEAPSVESVRSGFKFCLDEYISIRPQIELVRNIEIQARHGNVPAILYHPRPGKKLPVLVFFHGGGHVAGSAAEYAPICAKLALTTDHIVVCPEYRLAPEHPYPTDLDDACGAVFNVLDCLGGLGVNYFPQLSIGGDSCGGALAAMAALAAVYEKEVNIKRLALIYPCLDYTLTSNSAKRNGKGYGLETDLLSWFLDQYFQNGEDRRALSPLFQDVPDGFAETFVATAEFCPLRDDGFAYADKLKGTGVFAQTLHFDDMIHNFMAMEDIVPDACRKLYESVGIFLQS